jgi:hypothetical protein
MITARNVRTSRLTTFETYGSEIPGLIPFPQDRPSTVYQHEPLAFLYPIDILLCFLHRTPTTNRLARLAQRGYVPFFRVMPDEKPESLANRIAKVMGGCIGRRRIFDRGRYTSCSVRVRTVFVFEAGWKETQFPFMRLSTRAKSTLDSSIVTLTCDPRR